MTDPTPPPPDETQTPPEPATDEHVERARTAERKLRDLQQQFGDVKRQLDDSRDALQAVERRQRIDQLLVESDTIDLEATRLLTEAAVELMDEPDVKAAVDDLKRRKPQLFRQSRPRATGGSMSPRARGEGADADEAAAHAAATGDRRDLLRYLRMRRGGRG